MLLADAILQRNGYKSIFISGTPAILELPLQDAWDTTPVSARSGSALAEQLTGMCSQTQANGVVLHISVYGYQRRGVPLWLLEGVQIWRQAQPHVPLIGIFHELFATGHPWNSSFWLSSVQRYITRELWRLCDSGITNHYQYFDQLAVWRPKAKTDSKLKLMSVFSNIGEPDIINPSIQRPNHMVVFGGPGLEKRVYGSALSDFFAGAAKALNIERIVDIGARYAVPPTKMGRATVIPLGRLSCDLVSQHLLNCRFGLIDYDVGRLGKSGVFAAYAVHGVIPVCIGSQAQATDALEEGQHFLRWPFQRECPDLLKIQINLREWYTEHSLAKHADLVSSWLCNLCGSR
jgi:hypothetical protein